MNDDGEREDNLEDKLETHRVTGAKGVRLWLPLVLVAVGLLMIGAAVLGAKDGTGLLIGGFGLVLVFGWVAVGGRRIHIGASADGVEGDVELPQDETIRTTIRKKGFPRRRRTRPPEGPNKPS